MIVIWNLLVIGFIGTCIYKHDPWLAAAFIVYLINNTAVKYIELRRLEKLKKAMQDFQGSDKH